MHYYKNQSNDLIENINQSNIFKIFEVIASLLAELQCKQLYSNGRMNSKLFRTTLATANFAALLHCSNEYFFEMIAVSCDSLLFPLIISNACSSIHWKQLNQCIGPSMEPTFNCMGDLVITDKFSYRFLSKPRRGDVVMCTAPHDPSKTVVKRILAVVSTTRVVSRMS